MSQIRNFPFLVVRDQFYFPGSSCRLESVSGSFGQALEAALDTPGKTLALFASDHEKAGLDELAPFGVLAVARESSGSGLLEADVVERVRLRDLTTHPHPTAMVELLSPPTSNGFHSSLQDSQLRALAYQLFQKHSDTGRRAISMMEQIEEGQHLALVYFLASLLRLEPPQALAILAAQDVQLAQDQLLVALQPQLLGGREPAFRNSVWPWPDTEEQESLGCRFRERLEDLDLDEGLLERILPELERLEQLEPDLPEHHEALTRLESLLAFPWRALHARVAPRQICRVLDKAIHGHRQAKDLLLDLAATPRTSSPLVILVGPEGLGQGSLARALAAGQKRHLERIRLPRVGAADLLRGSSRQLPGAAPGAIYEAALRAGSRDPVLLMEAESRLDQATEHLLLQLTDPSESQSFSDHFLGLPINASAMRVLLQVRSLDLVPETLRQRAMVVPLQGYGLAEKTEILLRHLWPTALRKAGLRSAPLSSLVANWMVTHHSYRSGVSDLKQAAEQLARRLARERAAGCPGGPTLTLAHACLGQPWPSSPRGGVAIGVAAYPVLTPSGAEIQEVAAFIGSGAASREPLSDRLALAVSLAGENSSGQRWRSHQAAPPYSVDEAGQLFPLVMALRSAHLGVPLPRDLAVFGKLGLAGDLQPLGEAPERAMAAFRQGYRSLLLCPTEAEQLAMSLSADVSSELRLLAAADLETAWGLASDPKPRGLPAPRRGRIEVA